MSLTNQGLDTIVVDLDASRYINAAAITMLLYDHLLTFPDEYELIWRAEWKLPKILFLLVRYLVPVGIVLHTHQLTNFANSDVTSTYCQVIIAFDIMLAILAIAMSDFIIMLHVCNLWERKRRFMVLFIIFFVFTQAASVACAIITLPSLIPTVSFDESVKVCVIPRKSFFFIAWVPALFFDLAMIVIVLWNRTLRSHTEEFTKVTCGDGLIYFAILSTMRIANVVLMIAVPLPLIFLGILFVWCSSTVTVSRLTLRLRWVHVHKKLMDESEIIASCKWGLH